MSRARLAFCAAVLCLLGCGTSAEAQGTTRPKPPTLAQPVPKVTPATPCCGIVRIDLARAIVTARETATGFTFRFRVKERPLLRGLKVGDLVWADFATKTVKLRATDATPCCGIIETPPPAPPSASPNTES
jgi:Cu/Ag efflux protein CusF